MGFTNSRYLSVASGHTDSLIKYVLDVKPYHTKLSEIVEEYLFEDKVGLKIDEDTHLLAFLGADLLPVTLTTPGVRVRRSDSWVRDVTSDGTRRTWPAPLTAIPKLASHANRQHFIAGVDDDYQIHGIPAGVYNPTRWDGPGITDVRLNGAQQQDSYNYYLSHGVYSFESRAGQRWKELNIAHINKFAENAGELFYEDVIRTFGTIRNINLGNYEEWTLTVVSTSPATLEVSGSMSGVIGTATFGVPFVHPLLEFLFAPAPDEVDENASVDDVFILTPFNKVTVHPDAPVETWSIIKTNPIAIVSAPSFTPGPGAPVLTIEPSLKIHTRSLDRISEAQQWTVTFNGDGTYNVEKNSATDPYTISNLDLKDGCSFKNDDIHFTLIPTTNGFYDGDTFTFEVGPRVENFLVFGSVSGWQPNAKLGEWYWNGKIGFKIPKLEYFAEVQNSTVVTSISGDESTWSTTVANSQILRDVNYDTVNNIFITTGDGSIVGGSVDGQTWTSDIASLIVPQPNHFIVITGQNGVIAVSSDGILWESQATYVTTNLRASTQIPDFLTPLPYPPAIPNTLNCIIVVGDSGTILTSINATAWQQQNSGTSVNLNDITWSNDAIIAVGDNGTILRSLDRQNWSTIPTGTTSNLYSVVYEASVNSFIAVGDNGTILRSLDGGNTWLNISAFSTGSFTDVIFGDNEFVAVGPDGWVATSPTGASWIRYSGPRLNSIAYGNGRYVGVGGSTVESTQFVELKTVHSMAEPSVYTIDFITNTKATVVNNIYGYRKGLVVGENWSDEFVSFRIDPHATGSFSPGDRIRVFLTPKRKLYTELGYDEMGYDEHGYDVNVIDYDRPFLYNEEYFPLYHSHGSVIFKNGVTSGDAITIDKATVDAIRFKIEGASTKHAELAAVNDWIPLEFRHYDRLTSGVPSSEANFSDLTTYIEAYLCSDPTVRVFSIMQPRYEMTNRPASAIITFDENFYADYLGFSVKYSLQFMPDSVYAQKLRIKITENLRAYAKVNLIFDQFINVNFAELPIDHWEIITELNLVDVANMQFVEGGSLPFVDGYDILPYDIMPYDQKRVPSGVLVGFQEIGPGDYDYTGNPEDWIMTKPTNAPSIFVDQETSPDVTGASFREGLFIALQNTDLGTTVVEQLSTMYDVNIDTPAGGLLIETEATSYLITHNGPPVTPTLVVESLSNPGVYGSPTPNMNAYDQVPTAIATQSFTFSLPPGFTVPFRLTVT